MVFLNVVGAGKFHAPPSLGQTEDGNSLNFGALLFGECPNVNGEGYPLPLSTGRRARSGDSDFIAVFVKKTDLR